VGTSVSVIILFAVYIYNCGLALLMEQSSKKKGQLRKKEEEEGELLLIMLTYQSSREKKTRSVLSIRSRMHRRANARLHIYIPTKISTLV